MGMPLMPSLAQIIYWGDAFLLLFSDLMPMLSLYFSSYYCAAMACMLLKFRLFVRPSVRHTCSLSEIWYDDAERVSSALPIKLIILKIHDGGRPIRLRDPLCIIMRYCNLSIFKMAAVRRLGVLKLKFVIASYFRDTFCIITLNFVEIGRTVAAISHIFAFVGWNVKIH